MSCPPSPGRTPTGRATSATWPGSACRPTCSAGTCGWPATTCSWSAGPTSTGRRSSSRPTARASAPRELADRYNRVIAEDLTDLGLAYDLFTRTTTLNHYAVAQELFTGDWRNGYMVEQTTRGAISPSTGRTLPDRYIEGTCPICGYGQARGDQCDNCGNQLDATDLIEPHSRINGEVPAFVETQHFFLDLPALAGAIGVWLDEREASGTWRPSVLNFSKGLLEEVRPRAMTRDLDWGSRSRSRDGATSRRSGSTCGSTGGRLPLRVHQVGPSHRRPGALARVVERPRGAFVLLPGQGQHHLPLPHLARRAPRVCGSRRQGGYAGGVRRAEPADRGGGVAVPHHG